MLKLPDSETLGELDAWGRRSPVGFAGMSANPATYLLPQPPPHEPVNSGFPCRRRGRKLTASSQGSVATDYALGSESIATGRARYFFCCSSTN